MAWLILQRTRRKNLGRLGIKNTREEICRWTYRFDREVWSMLHMWAPTKEHIPQRCTEQPNRMTLLVGRSQTQWGKWSDKLSSYDGKGGNYSWVQFYEFPLSKASTAESPTTRTRNHAESLIWQYLQKIQSTSLSSLDLFLHGRGRDSFWLEWCIFPCNLPFLSAILFTPGPSTIMHLNYSLKLWPANTVSHPMSDQTMGPT